MYHAMLIPRYRNLGTKPRWTDAPYNPLHSISDFFVPLEVNDHPKERASATYTWTLIISEPQEIQNKEAMHY